LEVPTGKDPTSLATLTPSSLDSSPVKGSSPPPIFVGEILNMNFDSSMHDLSKMKIILIFKNFKKRGEN
jgi:hypothetical protein